MGRGDESKEELMKTIRFSARFGYGHLGMVYYEFTLCAGKEERGPSPGTDTGHCAGLSGQEEGRQTYSSQ